MKFSIQRKHIRSMLNLSAKKDIRYYLQGINVVIDNRGLYIEATDGLVLGRLLIDATIKSEEKKNVILPTDSLMKLKGSKKDGEEFLHFTVDGFSVECIAGDSTIRFSRHDARFPDTDRVIPLLIKNEDVKSSTINPDLLVRFVDFSQDLYGKRQVPQLLQRGTDSALVSFSLDDNFIGVVMPFRENSPAKVPEWCYFSSVKKEEVTA